MSLKPQPTKVERRENPEVTPERVAKLPKWAREHLRDLERERDTAVRSLNDYCDSQTPSKCYADTYVCTGEKQGPVTKRAYFNAKESIRVLHDGIELCVDFFHQDELVIRFNGAAYKDDVAIVPISRNSIRFVRKDDLRG